MKIQTIKGIGAINWASLNYDGSLIVAGTEENDKQVIKLYDIVTKKLKTIWKSGDRNTLQSAFHPLKANYIACCDQENMGLVDWKEEKILFQIPIEYGFVPKMAFSQDGLNLFIVHSFFSKKNIPDDWDSDKNGPYCITEIIKIDIESKAVIEKIFLNDILAQGADFNNTRNLVGIRYLGGEAEIWDIKDKKSIQSVIHRRGSKCVNFLNDNSFLTDAFPDNPKSCLNNVIMWDIKTGNEIAGYRPHEMKLHSMGCVQYKKEGQWILSGSEDRRVCLWNLETGNVIWSKQFRSDVNIAISEDGHKGVISSLCDPLLVEF